MNEDILKRISIDPDVCFGKPTIRNTRYSVDMLLDLLASGMSEEEILDDYPALEKDDLRAVYAFASKLSKVKTINRVVA